MNKKKDIVFDLGVKLVYDTKKKKFKTFIRTNKNIPYQRVRSVVEIVKHMMPFGLEIEEQVVERTITDLRKGCDVRKKKKTLHIYNSGKLLVSIPNERNSVESNRQKTIVNNIFKITNSITVCEKKIIL